MHERLEVEYRDFFKARKQIKVDIGSETTGLLSQIKGIENKIKEMDQGQR